MTKEELLPGCVAYFNGDTLAAEVWLDKYALKDQSGNIYEKTPTDMHRRLAKQFARIEQKYPNPMGEDEIFALFENLKYIVPQGSPMFGIGNDFSITSLSNCFVIGSNGQADSYGSILRSDEEQVQLMKRRGGVGQDLSHLRPSGSMANNSALSGMAGAVLYAQRFSNSTKEVRQGDRRGALMLTMSIEHPDAEKFIDSKLVDGAVTDANISLRITDRFMAAVVADEDFIQTFPTNYRPSSPTLFSDQPYDESISVTTDTHGLVYIKRVRAKRIWDKIIRNAWKSAEPGVMFWDKIIRESPADCYPGFKTVSTNPCGEIPSCEYDSCRLLAINLYSYVDNPFTAYAQFNTERFKVDVQKAQRLMDDLVDLELEKIDKILAKIQKDPENRGIKKVEWNLWSKIRYTAIQGRRTGLGVTAEGDMLAALGLTYGSEAGIAISVYVHRLLAMNSYISSIVMAQERGAFGAWSFEAEEKHSFLNRVLDRVPREIYTMYKMYGRRNISNLTIAPTGTTSLMTQSTSGVEPCFNVAYKRRRRTIDKAKATFIDDQGEMFEDHFVFHHKFIEWFRVNYWEEITYKDELTVKTPKEWLEGCGESLLQSYIKESPYNQSTSADVDWVAKVKMQGAIQQWVDHSISATTNIPKDTPVEIVHQIYMAAYESGCKGMTIYREGSRSGILVSEEKEKLVYIDAVKRPKDLPCDIYHKTAIKKDWMILVGKLEGRPYEIFAFPDLPNHTFPAKIEKGVLTKIKSGVYKLIGLDEFGKAYVIENIIELLVEGDQVNTRRFSMMLRHHIDPKWIIHDIEEYSLITSFDKVVQRVLRNYVTPEGNHCPHCGTMLINEDGCIKCLQCGYSKCG